MQNIQVSNETKRKLDIIKQQCFGSRELDDETLLYLMAEEVLEE